MTGPLEEPYALKILSDWSNPKKQRLFGDLLLLFSGQKYLIQIKLGKVLISVWFSCSSFKLKVISPRSLSAR